MEIATDQTIKLTEGAIQEISRILRFENPDNKESLRIGVKGGGCSGLSYIMDLDNATEKDKRIDVGNISIVIDKAHLLYLEGVTLQYENGLNNRGFVFENPNASEKCGCGSSFSV
jgi:iron-sulfur cluster assembly protein